ncbi:hypothetical protein [Phormidium tenue]|uniref:Uncharacterized protein n=1 Tax=Phormidium tenue FACHB-1050 TaxID=2692857 RepID=A0ABR8CBA3_9CYAN|nr:hypothetical protein [Phormidium tenue]MBD2316709.1 hypothetical protein [Phormidium tenue FACHB-1050]
MTTQRPNEGTLWRNESKDSPDAPAKKGQLLITRSLLLELCEQQGKGGDFLVDVFAWERGTVTGETILSIMVKKPCEFGEQPTAPAPAPKAPPDPAKYLAALKAKIALVQNSVQFQELYAKIKSDEVWAVFKSVPAIAQEAANLLAEYQKKFAPNIPKDPSDLSDLISKIDVEFERLKLHPKAHCLERWGKSRQKLSAVELQIYLDELQLAQPIPPSDDFF